MRFTWPPSEQSGWIIDTEKTKEKDFFLPIRNQDLLLLAVRIRSTKPVSELRIQLPDKLSFLVPLASNTWTQLPYPIEQHAVNAFWLFFSLKEPGYEIDLAYYPWKSRMFRMRALINEEGSLIGAYRINKNGQTVAYIPPKDDMMKLPEDTYLVPPTHLINQKSIILVPAQNEIRIKKAPEVGILGI